MLEKFKEYTSQAQKRWTDMINESQKGYAEIDMTQEILKILNQGLLHIVFGTNMDSNKVLIDFQETTTEPCKQKEFGINDAVEIAAKQTMSCAPFRLLNPLWILIMKLTGKCVAFGKA